MNSLRPHVPIRSYLIGNAVLLIILIIIFLVFKNIFHLMELSSLDARFQIRERLNKTPIIHENIVHINIDDYSRIESGKIVEWPKRYYSELINTHSKSIPN